MSLSHFLQLWWCTAYSFYAVLAVYVLIALQIARPTLRSSKTLTFFRSAKTDALERLLTYWTGKKKSKITSRIGSMLRPNRPVRFLLVFPPVFSSRSVGCRCATCFGVCFDEYLDIRVRTVAQLVFFDAYLNIRFTTKSMYIATVIFLSLSVTFVT